MDVAVGEVVRVCAGRWGDRIRSIPSTVMGFIDASTGMTYSETIKERAVIKIAVSRAESICDLNS